MKHIKIFDTTLRDGQQCPGAGMSFEQNIEYAHLATELGIDVLEAGFPSASKLDFEIVSKICEEISSIKEGPIVAALCQLRDEQIDITIEALKVAVPHNKARLHTYVPVDPNLMEASLGSLANDKSQIEEDVYNFIKRATDAGLEVEFSPEGYSRMGSNFDFVTNLIRAAVRAGATTINCPDTIGGACRLQGEEYFVNKMNKHAEIIAKEFPKADVTWSVHCHNDFGLAVENSINGVIEGPATQIEGCINGVGERAGNVALEQCILILKHFAENEEFPYKTRINTEKLKSASDFIAKNMLPRQPHWPVIGANSAKHSSGGHTNAILHNLNAYQPFNPSEVGQEVSFMFGPLSGGNHAKSIVEAAGYVCEDSEKAEVSQFIKELYKERRKGITDEELIKGYLEFRKPIRVENFDYSRSSTSSSVCLTGKFYSKEGEIQETYEGRDSALAALKQAIDAEYPGLTIQEHKSNSDGEGFTAKSISTIIVKDSDDELYQGIGEDRDIEISAMKALIDAANCAFIHKNFIKE